MALLPGQRQARVESGVAVTASAGRVAGAVVSLDERSPLCLQLSPPCECPFRLVQLPLVAKRNAQVVVHLGDVRVESDGRPKQLDGCLEVPPGRQARECERNLVGN